MTTPEFLGGLAVAIAQLTLPIFYALYKGHDVSIHIRLGPGNQKRR